MDTSTTPLAPTGTQQAVNNIDRILGALLQRDKNIIGSLNKILNNSKNPDGSAIAPADIIAAGGARYANLQAFITAMETGVNILAPGTFPVA